MTLPSPFAYSESEHSRRHGPIGYEDYQSFKDWLRDEFQFRCIYCLFRERWYPSGYRSFSVEHVIPRSADRGGASELDYQNLAYACNRCNAFRVAENVLNPLQSPLNRHMEVNDEDGSIRGLTPDGEKTIRILKLNDPIFCDYRRRAFLVLQIMRENPDNLAAKEMFGQVFGYPDDLPDLRRLRPPKGNAKSGSAESCYYALRERGELGEVY
jgi:HNH endonuclease